MGSSDIPVCAMQIAITFGRFLALKSVNSPIYYIYLNILCPTDKNVCATTEKKTFRSLCASEGREDTFGIAFAGCEFLIKSIIIF